MFTKGTFAAACITGVVLGGIAGVIIADDSAGEFWKSLELRQRRSERPKIGVYTAEPSRTLAAQLGIDRRKSTVITSLVGGGAAERAGLQAYDIITSIDGSDDADPSDLNRALRGKKWGDEIQLVVCREGKPHEFVVPLERAPKLGVYTEEPEEMLAAQLGLDRKKAAVITGLVDGGAAERAGLRASDIIVRIDGTDDAGPGGLTRALGRKFSRDAIALDILRDGQPVYFVVPLGATAID